MNDIKYEIILSRRRSISIIVRPDKSVIVRAPLRTPAKVIEKFVQSKSSWIRKHINSEPGIRLTDQTKKFTGGDIFLFLGKEYKLRIIVTNDLFVKLNEDHIEVGQKDPADSNITRLLISHWYLLKAKEILKDKLNENLRRYSEQKFVPAGLVIRQLKSR
jgi:predicted metal-dependent hydrolase